MKTIFRVCLFSILIMAIFINIVNADNELIYKISGQSMSPTLIDGDYVSVTAKDSYKENDIVIAKNRLNQDYIIKRIKGDYLIGDNEEHSVILELSNTDIMGSVDVIFDSKEFEGSSIIDIEIAKALDPLDPSLATTVSTNIKSISSIFKINDRYFIMGTNTSDQYCIYEVVMPACTVVMRYNFSTNVADTHYVATPILVGGKYKFWIECEYSNETLTSFNYRNSVAVVSTTNFTSFAKDAVGLFSHNGTRAKIYSVRLDKDNGYFFATVVRGTNNPTLYNYTSSYSCKTGNSSEREVIRHEFDIDSIEVHRSTNLSSWSRIWYDNTNPKSKLWVEDYYGGVSVNTKILDPIMNHLLVKLTKKTEEEEKDKWSYDYDSEWNWELSLIYQIYNGVTIDYDIYEYEEQKEGYDYCDKPSPLPSMEKEGEKVYNTYTFSDSCSYLRVDDYRMMYDYKGKYGPVVKYRDYYYYVNGKFVDSDYEYYDDDDGKYYWSSDPINKYRLFADMTSLYYDDYKNGNTDYTIYYSSPTKSRTQLLYVNNYSGKEFYKSADKTQIYLKIDLSTGTSNYYRIKDGTCTTITASTYNSNKPIPPPVEPPLPPALVTPDNLYSEIGYSKYYADNLYAIFYNATEKKLKIVIGNSIPVIEVLSPSPDGIFSAVEGYNTISLSGTVSDADTGDILTVYYRIDGAAGSAGTQIGGNITANGTAQAYSGSVNVGSLSAGDHTLYTWVEDDKGGKSAEVSRAFTVDKTAPTVSFNPSANTKVNSTGTISVTVTSTDTAGVNQIKYILKDNNTYVLTEGDLTGVKTGSSYSTTVNTGTNCIYVMAIDNVGNKSAILKSPLYRINKVPSADITNPADETWFKK